MGKICKELHELFSGMKRMTFPFDEKSIPKNGIYILFEKGEKAHNTDRIVRIGTHTGQDQLRSRLKQHFINENKDRSIFRKNIGRALLNKNNDPFLDDWEIDLTTKKAKEHFSGKIDAHKKKEVEQAVTKYIQENFSFVAFQVDNKEKRMEMESKIISSISACDICKPSSTWLGNYSPKEKIKKSGLWLVNELYKEPLSEIGLEELKKMTIRFNLMKNQSLLFIKPEILERYKQVITSLQKRGYSILKEKRIKGYKALARKFYTEFTTEELNAYLHAYDKNGWSDECMILFVTHKSGDTIKTLKKEVGNFIAYQQSPETTLRGEFGLPADFNEKIQERIFTYNGFHAVASEEELVEHAEILRLDSFVR